MNRQTPEDEINRWQRECTAKLRMHDDLVADPKRIARRLAAARGSITRQRSYYVEHGPMPDKVDAYTHGVTAGLRWAERILAEDAHRPCMKRKPTAPDPGYCEPMEAGPYVAPPLPPPPPMMRCFVVPIVAELQSESKG